VKNGIWVTIKDSTAAALCQQSASTCCASYCCLGICLAVETAPLLLHVFEHVTRGVLLGWRDRMRAGSRRGHKARSRMAVLLVSVRALY
jgi:hypothetical protein